ncbi:MAG: 4Fe-4S dicluster domain-containing protein [Actinobacteria bacterium]|nr:4Fe-4S dicluster domain-containing protein [Actinomycetota bacterium]MBU1942038.1 4Fe-4S dicluster domain-containing protein [Actinomycetota bacterium]MBU2687191.1 4Fe-4S dicluster domain-containing protein [Actinomycetota bacterium]
MDPDSKLESLAERLGADFYGVADLGPVLGTVVEQGGNVVAGYHRAVSVGIKMVGEIVDMLPRREEPSVAARYMHHCYDVINYKLDNMTSRLATELRSAGHAALPVPASKRYDDELIRAIFSNKMAARLAGLGWIGRSCLLVTPEVGPRVRWAAVLTDAPLEATGAPEPERCGDCEECVSICPVGAFTGRAFTEGEPREARFDARACERYLTGLRSCDARGVCGLCVYVCPHGRTAAPDAD